ncbi:MAG: NAD(P)/FAD-dependent oxidoreductase [Rhodospirillaceae bacterium]|nr:NAD(P)/FAD-dependent oxidoreductase [Rhodospirillaceae bacterium]
MTETVECVVVGAGVIGLAVARALALTGREVVILEAAQGIGTETSSRNSEVIHAGIYYPTGSLKARLCVAGRRRLYAYCAARGIEHRRLGKLIVATGEAQRAELLRLQARAAANGVEDMALLDAAALKRLEPAVRGVAALLSGSTGIIDSHGLMLSLLGEAEAAGAMAAFRTPVVGGRVEDGGFVIETGGAEPMAVRCRLLVNSAGLGAAALARRIAGVPPDSVPAMRLCKGNYFSLAGRAPFARLIYPIPEEAGLGVHVTLDLAGTARFGPDVEWTDRIDYAVDPARAARFAAAIRTYYPGLDERALQPAYAGIRPKLHGPGEPAADFLIQGPEGHGVPGLVNLYGIESPGLTAALAIADEVAARLGVPALAEAAE